MTFRKFLSAGKLCEADVVMLCGDITGKMLVPIVKWPDGTYSGRVLGLELRDLLLSNKLFQAFRFWIQDCRVNHEESLDRDV